MASIIKASSPKPFPAVGTFDFQDLSARAQVYVNEARAEAAALLAQAQSETAAIRHRAQQEGLEAAQRAAESLVDEKISKQMASLLPALEDAVNEIEQARHAWMAHCEKTTLHMALAIARRIVRRELSQEPEITLSLIKEALEMASGTSAIRLRLHPLDHAALSGHVRTLVDELTRLGDAQVIADPTISQGGCRLDTSFGVIDQQLEAQLARIEQELQ